MDEVRAGPGLAGSAVETFLSNTFSKVEEMGPLGPLYFGAIYVLAEVLIIPALPFTAAAGYLFGVAGGTAIVLTAATIAAGLSFLLGRTFLRWEKKERGGRINRGTKWYCSKLCRPGYVHHVIEY